MTDYLGGLKTALTGAPDTPLAFLCNFEVEVHWARGHVGLPAPGGAALSPVVRAMEQLGALLAGPDDLLITSAPLDKDYRDYVHGLGLRTPTVVVADDLDPAASTTRRALNSPDVLARLGELADAGGAFLPMGVSADEQALAEKSGLRLAVPDAVTAERVNGKIYGRRLTEAAGLRPVPGHCVERVGELDEVLRANPPSAERKVVVKDSYGVSGKGLVVLDSPAAAGRLMRLVRRRAERNADDRLHVVVEHWLPKRFDLNYQFTIDATGRTTFDFVKQAITVKGVHSGHLMPPDLDAAQLGELHEAAQAVGARLYADGFTGVAGVDAILGLDGLLYPVLEINARLNMSTYQGRVTEKLHRPGQLALAKHYTLRLDASLDFPTVHTVLNDQVVVTCFGTVNANATAEPPFEGRLYTILFAPDRTALTELDEYTAAALRELPHCLEVR